MAADPLTIPCPVHDCHPFEACTDNPDAPACVVRCTAYTNR